MNYTIEYYKWWLTNVGMLYLNEAKQDSLKAWLNQEKSQEATLRIVWKVIQLKRSFKNTYTKERRILGRSAEVKVVDILLRNGWSVESQIDLPLYPKFGESTIGYDIVGTYQNSQPRYIEVKSCRGPFLFLGYKAYYRYRENLNNQNSFYVFINEDDKAYYVRTSQIKFSGTVKSPIPGKDWNYLWVIDPECLTELE